MIKQSLRELWPWPPIAIINHLILLTSRPLEIRVTAPPSQCHAYLPTKRKYILDCAYGYTLIIMAYCFIPIFHITCFEVGQVGKYITNLILKDFKETKYLVKNLLQSCMWKLKTQSTTFIWSCGCSFCFFFFGWLVIYVAYDNLFKYSKNAAQFFILAVLSSRFPVMYFVA